MRLHGPKAEGRLSCRSRHRCPITQIRTLDHVTALREIGRYGDFGRIDGLHKQCKRSARSPPRRLHCWPDTSHSLVPLREAVEQRHRILLRDCRSFTGLGENWLRIGLQSPRNNRRIVRALRQELQRNPLG